ncbi:hypothetical protein EMCRGX_G024060 [Ephydatia muelleri]
MENVSCEETVYHQRPIGYSIQFEPEKPSAPAPKRIKEYALKPLPSYQELERKLFLASIRKKCLEQERLDRIRRNARLWHESSQHKACQQAL